MSTILPAVEITHGEMRARTLGFGNCTFSDNSTFSGAGQNVVSAQTTVQSVEAIVLPKLSMFVVNARRAAAAATPSNEAHLTFSTSDVVNTFATGGIAPDASSIVVPTDGMYDISVRSTVANSGNGAKLSVDVDGSVVHTSEGTNTVNFIVSKFIDAHSAVRILNDTSTALSSAFVTIALIR